MKTIYKKRLLKLAKYLQTKIKPKNFDMVSICSWSNDSDLVWNPKNGKFDPFDCGSTCCAVGCAPLCFPELNLTYDFDQQEIKRKGKTWHGLKFFGIDTIQWSYLFDSIDSDGNRRDETPKQVARRIINFVKNDGKVPHNWYN